MKDATVGKRAKTITLKTKFYVLMGAVILAGLGFGMAWQTVGGTLQAERELLQQARALSANMDAVWDFMTLNQDIINYDSEGGYDFKGLQCSIVGRSVGALFSMKTSYETRYVSENPRNEADLPDYFESQALDVFEADGGIVEYYQVVGSGDSQVFRYVAPMRIEESCLECHGSPAGEIDESGYAKEGMAEGDLYGAISLSIPMSVYGDAQSESILSNAAFIVVMLAGCITVFYVALRKLVTKPLDRAHSAMAAIGRGDLSARMAPDDSSAEMQEMTKTFNRMAEDLSSMYDGLEDKVEERTRELAQANELLKRQQDELKKLNKRLVDDNEFKSAFLAKMSHELKTPLAAAMSFGSILREHRGECSEEEGRLWREMEFNNKMLLSLINNILEMARIDAGKERLNLGVLDVGDIVGMLQYSLEPLARHKRLAMEYDIEEDMPLLVVDADKVQRIVTNLVSNAIKYTDEGGRVKFSVRFDASCKGAVFSVSDTGIGIAEEELASIFERFVQAGDLAEKQSRGSGLGLAVVKELAEMHGGSVEAQSIVGKGSVFEVFIPGNLSLDE